MADCVRGMCMNLWKAMVHHASQDVYRILRKRLRRYPEGRVLVNRLMKAYRLDVDEALGLFMALYCLLEDNMPCPGQGKGDEAGAQG